jgi:hypothetical protein
MAVAKRATPEVLKLDDGQEVNIVMRRSGFDVGTQEAIERAKTELEIKQRRADTLRAKAEKAADSDSDEQFNSSLQEFQDFSATGKYAKLIQCCDQVIIGMVVKWDMCLTEEDEAAGKTVPLNFDGLTQLGEVLRLDLFTKLVAKIKPTLSDAEKKDSSVNSNGATQTQTENSEASQTSSSVMLLPSATGSDQAQSNDGM